MEVYLTRAPSATVSVRARLTQADPSMSEQARLSSSELEFAPDTWTTPQSFTITGVDDMVADGTQFVTLVFEAVDSQDPDFAGQLLASVQLEVLDGVCGNGVQEGDEACDTGSSPSDTCPYGQQTCQLCTSTCTFTPGLPGPSCGDGITQTDEEEACDAGKDPSLDCDRGEASCTVCNDQCQEQPGNRVGNCGDGNVQADQGEECDPGETPNLNCAYGEMSCTVCQNDCTSGPGTFGGSWPVIGVLLLLYRRRRGY